MAVPSLGSGFTISSAAFHPLGTNGVDTPPSPRRMPSVACKIPSVASLAGFVYALKSLWRHSRISVFVYPYPSLNPPRRGSIPSDEPFNVIPRKHCLTPSIPRQKGVSLSGWVAIHVLIQFPPSAGFPEFESLFIPPSTLRDGPAFQSLSPGLECYTCVNSISTFGGTPGILHR